MNLNNVKYINEFRRLPYPKNQMIIIGSGTLALLGIRKNNDIDIWCSPALEKKIAKDKNFTYKISKLDGSKIYVSKDEIFEISSTLGQVRGSSFDDALKRSLVVYGIHFHNPRDVLHWKKTVNRPKDRDDIKKLEAYLKKNVVETYLAIMQSIRG